MLSNNVFQSGSPGLPSQFFLWRFNMVEKVMNSGVVSWESYDALYEHHVDCLRKVRFFAKSGNALKEERTALEIIADFLKQKENDAGELRQNALAERDRVGFPEERILPENQESKLYPLSMRQEDRPVFGKLREICSNGGDEWENLKAMTEATYATLRRRQR
jgi:hypothetical protein